MSENIEMATDVAKQVLVTKSDLAPVAAVTVILGLNLQEWSLILITFAVVFHKLALTYRVLFPKGEKNGEEKV